VDNNIYVRKIRYWQKIIMAMAIIGGILLCFQKNTELISMSYVDFSLQQKNEIKKSYGFISEDKKRLAKLPLEQYILEKTNGKISTLPANEFVDYFENIKLIYDGKIKQSKFQDKVSSEDLERLSLYTNNYYSMPVFFTTKEIPLEKFNLTKTDKDFAYIEGYFNNKKQYLKVEYNDYFTNAGPMTSIFSEPPSNIWYPYRKIGLGIIMIGLLLGFLRPSVKKTNNLIEYPQSKIIISDILGLMLLIFFFALPLFIIGSIPALNSEWIILPIVFWSMAIGGLIIIYSSAVYASFQLSFTEKEVLIATAGKFKQYQFSDIVKFEQVTMENPKWFKRLFFWVLLLSLLSGRATSPGSAGSYMLAKSASYQGLAIYFNDDTIQYIWFTDALGNVLLPQYQEIIKRLKEQGIILLNNEKVIEKFLPLP